ncbi:acetoacetyl-CoA synthetase [Trichonephila clavipes]|nr:acetoacetyl-CoA synthetase [Trichonephila clavipes]
MRHEKDSLAVRLVWMLSVKLNSQVQTSYRRAQVPPSDGNWVSKLLAANEVMFSSDVPKTTGLVLVGVGRVLHSKIVGICFLDEFLQLGFEKDGSVPPIVFEQVSVSHPVFISYTSGTTGQPKAIIHGSGGFLATAKDSCVYGNRTREGTLLSMSPVGWASWNIFTTFLFTGVKCILFEGVPYFLSPTYLWDLVDEFKLTELVSTPSVLDELEKRGYFPTEKHSLESLKVIICGSSVVKPNNYEFVYNKIKKEIMFGSAYGISLCCITRTKKSEIHVKQPP